MSHPYIKRCIALMKEAIIMFGLHSCLIPTRCQSSLLPSSAALSSGNANASAGHVH